MDMIWCRNLMPGANQARVRPRLCHLVKSVMYSSTDECFSAAGRNKCAPDDHGQWALRCIRWLYVVGWHQRCVNSTEWPRLSPTEHPLLQGGSSAQSPSMTPRIPRILSENEQDISVLHDCGSGLAFINTLQPGDHIFLDSAFRNKLALGRRGPR